jgi:hypothetical protein
MEMLVVLIGQINATRVRLEFSARIIRVEVSGHARFRLGRDAP